MPNSRERSDRRRSRSPKNKDRDENRGRERGRERQRDGDRGARRSKFDRSSPQQEGGHYGPTEAGGGFPNVTAPMAEPAMFNPESSGPIIPTNYDLPSRKIYVGGIGQHHSENDVKEFLGQMLHRAKACIEEGNPIIKTQINRDKRYIFVELRTAEEAAALMQLDGIDF